MTMVVHGLIRVAPGDDPATWEHRYGDRWPREVERPLRELHFMPAWLYVHDALRQHRHYRLDWGTTAWEIGLDQLRRLLGPRPAGDPIFLQLERDQNAALNALDPTARYLVYAMEC